MQAMVLCVAVLVLCPLSATNIEHGVAVVGKAHTAMKLHRAVTGKQQRLGGLGLGHAAGDLSIFRHWAFI